jgi:hypothetical protein
LPIPSAFVHAQYQVPVEAAFARLGGAASRCEKEGGAMHIRQHDYTSPAKSSRVCIAQAHARIPHNR